MAPMQQNRAVARRYLRRVTWWKRTRAGNATSWIRRNGIDLDGRRGLRAKFTRCPRSTRNVREAEQGGSAASQLSSLRLCRRSLTPLSACQRFRRQRQSRQWQVLTNPTRNIIRISQTDPHFPLSHQFDYHQVAIHRKRFVGWQRVTSTSVRARKGRSPARQVGNRIVRRNRQPSVENRKSPLCADFWLTMILIKNLLNLPLKLERLGKPFLAPVIDFEVVNEIAQPAQTRIAAKPLLLQDALETG